MPIDFSQFVFRPQPLQRWNIGEAFNDVIQGNRFRQQQAQQESQYARTRSDTQAAGAADLAIKQNEVGYGDALKKYAKRAELANDARAAWAAGQYAKVRALGGQLAALGGTFREVPVPGKLSNFDIDPGQAPTRPGLDIPGARRSLYGPSSVEVSAPFQVPGFGPDGKRNPMDPPSMPGLSAAAMPQGPTPGPVNQQTPALASTQPGQPQPGPPNPSQSSTDAAGPPPGPARSVAPPGAVWLPPGMDPGTAPPPEAPAAGAPAAENEAPQQGQAPQPASPQLTGPNPLEAPMFSPYRLDTNAQVAENQARLQPWMAGTRGGVPAEYQYRMDKINDAALQLGLPPEDTLKLYQPAFGTITGLMRADINRETARASMGLRGQAMENSRNLQIQRLAASRVDKIGEKFALSKNNKRWMDVDSIKSLLEARTGQADTQAISLLRDSYQDGVMTDADFENVKSGPTRTLWQKIKDGTFETFVANGVSPDTRAALFQLVDIAKKNAAKNILTAQNQLLSTVRNPRSSSTEERDYYINEIAKSVPEALWDPLVREAMGMEIDQKSGPVDSAGNYAVRPAVKSAAGSENIGTSSSLPSTLDGKGGKVSANATASKSKTTVMVDGKPKNRDQLTQADLDKMTPEQLEELLNDPTIGQQ